MVFLGAGQRVYVERVCMLFLSLNEGRSSQILRTFFKK